MGLCLCWIRVRGNLLLLYLQAYAVQHCCYLSSWRVVAVWLFSFVVGLLLARAVTHGRLVWVHKLLLYTGTLQCACNQAVKLRNRYVLSPTFILRSAVVTTAGITIEIAAAYQAYDC